MNLKEVKEKKCPDCSSEDISALGNIYTSDMEFGEGHDLYGHSHSLYKCSKCDTKFIVEE